MVKIFNLYAKSISYGGNRSAGSIKYLIFHYTGNPTDKAVNNARYFAPGGGNTRNAGAHYFVDDTSIYRSIPDTKVAWSVGGSGVGTMKGSITNYNSLSIEMCSTGSKITDKTMANAIDLAVTLMKKYNIPMSRVYRHYDVTAKQCPGWSGWYGSNCPKWTSFKSKLNAKLNPSKTTTVKRATAILKDVPETKKPATNTTVKRATAVLKDVQETKKTTTAPKTNTTAKKPSAPKVNYYPKYNGISRSLVDVMNALKINSAFSNRAKIAAKNRIVSKASDYRGTSAQNLRMLTLLKQGKLIKP